MKKTGSVTYGLVDSSSHGEKWIKGYIHTFPLFCKEKSCTSVDWTYSMFKAWEWKLQEDWYDENIIKFTAKFLALLVSNKLTEHFRWKTHKNLHRHS